ncbi:hypothetical protein VULLAG_LOCUS12178 [Vulpes lagopus]
MAYSVTFLLGIYFGKKATRISINKWIRVVQGVDCSECLGMLPKSLFRYQGLISLGCCNCCCDIVPSSRPSQQIASTKDNCQTQGYAPFQHSLQAMPRHLGGKKALFPHSIGQLRGTIPASAGSSGAFPEITLQPNVSFCPILFLSTHVYLKSAL